MAAVINPATGSTHDAPVNAKMIDLARAERDRSTLILVAAAPGGIRFSLRAVPAFFWAAVSTGMMIGKSTRMMVLSGEGAGVLSSDCHGRARVPVPSPSVSPVRVTSFLPPSSTGAPA
uniref:Uncharacterized protein n=1 Tax=Kocuria rosea subsp. polaris TaxID=136273 RepID=A0A0A6VM40_KOCRO|nr:hypothetical protein GY22_17115 [Kocuria polaris]